MQKPKVWSELLYRTCVWRGLDDIRESDYKVMGGPLPGAEFPTVSSAFSMFRTVPEGLEDYFDRPMQSLDILQLVTYWKDTKTLTTVPLIIVSRTDVFRLGLNKEKINWQEVSDSPEFVAVCIPGFNNNKTISWKSRLKTTV